MVDAYRSAQHELGALVAEVRSRRSFWSFFDRASDGLRFHDDGVVIVRHDETTELIRWDSIVEVCTIAHGRDCEEYVLRTNRSTHRVRLTRPGSDIARARLHEATLARLLAAAHAELREGSVSFGPLVVDVVGIRTEFTDLRWHRIADVRAQQLAGKAGIGLVVHGRDGTWIELPLRDVPNEHVLIALSRELRAGDPYATVASTETAVTALKRLADAQQRAPDAMTIGPRTHGPRRGGPIDSSQ